MIKIMKPIKDYEGLYSITEYGEIWSNHRNIYRKHNIIQTGYHQVRLCKNGIIKSYYIAKLVAKAFIPNPENKTQVNHIDGNKDNNHASNLEWMTPRENVQHAVKLGLLNNKGENHGSSKLNRRQVLEIRKRYKEENITQKSLADEYEVSLMNINKIINYKTWSWL